MYYFLKVLTYIFTFLLDERLEIAQKTLLLDLILFNLNTFN